MGRAVAGGRAHRRPCYCGALEAALLVTVRLVRMPSPVMPGLQAIW